MTVVATYHPSAHIKGLTRDDFAAQIAADLTRRESVASLTELRERQERLQLWRELSAPILDPENLHQYLRQQAFGDLEDEGDIAADSG